MTGKTRVFSAVSTDDTRRILARCSGAARGPVSSPSSDVRAAPEERLQIIARRGESSGSNDSSGAISGEKHLVDGIPVLPPDRRRSEQRARRLLRPRHGSPRRTVRDVLPRAALRAGPVARRNPDRLGDAGARESRGHDPRSARARERRATPGNAMPSRPRCRTSRSPCRRPTAFRSSWPRPAPSATVHAGWRGTAANAASAAVRGARGASGAAPPQLQAWIGPFRRSLLLRGRRRRRRAIRRRLSPLLLRRPLPPRRARRSIVAQLEAAGVSRGAHLRRTPPARCAEDRSSRATGETARRPEG